MRAVPALLLVSACAADPPPVQRLPELPPRAGDESPSPPGPERPLRELVIAWTGEVRGEVEPCGCPTVPYGGFARRSRLLDRLREEGPPVFVLDSGQMLLKGVSSVDRGDRAVRARAVLDLALGVGLDAWAPSPLDLLPGGPRLLDGTGALSATWEGWAPARILERGGVRLGVVGVSAPREGERPVNVVESVRSGMASAGSADAWVALSNADEATTRAVAEAVPELGAVLAVRGERLDPPRATTRAPVLETPDRGRYLSVLRVALGSTPGPWTLTDTGPLAQLASLREQGAGFAPGAARDAHAVRVGAAREGLAEAARGRNLVRVDHRPLGVDLDGPAVVDPRLAALKAQSTALARARVEERIGERYVSAGGCVRCHSDRVAAWTLSPHARALEPLTVRAKDTDPECVGCHTTGWGEPGGFASLDPATLATWHGVQCEACHGPRSGHGATTLPDPSRPPTTVPEVTCLRCHDEANSPQFDYPTWLRRVSCWAVSHQDAAVPPPRD